MSILITRPDHDPLMRYFYAWSEEIVSLARNKGVTIYDLKSKKATRANFESYIQHHPRLVFINGHGSTEVIMGYNNEPLVDMASNFQGLIMYARSCDAAKNLGVHLVKNGVVSFIGYKRKFFCGYSPDKTTKPLKDRIAELFLVPSNLVVSTLLKGHSAGEAHLRSRTAMYKNFRRMVSSAASYEERFASRWMWSNINNQILLGNASVTM